jgi:hypothetical protein
VILLKSRLINLTKQRRNVMENVDLIVEEVEEVVAPSLLLAD